MKEIAAALVKAQKAFGPALKTGNNPAFRSKYAKLENCIEAVIDALNDNGIMLMQNTHDTDSGITVETIFLHESGEFLSNGKLFLPAAKHDPQGFGSALTYARRYSLMAACGIAPEDDDGEAAMTHYRKEEPKPKPVAKPPLKVEGKTGEWQVKVEVNRNDDQTAWLSAVMDAFRLTLSIAKTVEDLNEIFKVNRVIFDSLKEVSPDDHAALLTDFTKRKKELS